MNVVATALAGVVASTFLSAPVAAQLFGPIQDTRANYKRSFPGLPGYTDKKKAAGVWEVSANVGGGKPYWVTEKVALFRASELVISEGKPFVQVSVKKAIRQVGMYGGGGLIVLRIVAVTEKDPVGHCEAQISVFTCKTFPADIAMSEARPFLKFSSERRP